MMNFGMIMYMIFLVVIFGFIIYGILLLITNLLNKYRTPSPEQDQSLQILKERFARGELSEEEFEQKQSYLKKLN
ncbi:SHOCT domain-containing protein [Alkalihalobacillus deserti]|uniref:SHOCT domain-containing protein n=1 Tax=Alkalihalobacillus deserti TaxID=2879466 RepID=UPI001D154ECC|nr:SHOCT domain-containing protein [Alkalihalobacillus deserti]